MTEKVYRPARFPLMKTLNFLIFLMAGELLLLDSKMFYIAGRGAAAELPKLFEAARIRRALILLHSLGA